MNKHRPILLYLVLVLACGSISLFAQTPATVGNVDSKAISIEVGMNTGLGVATSAITVGRYFSLGLTISDNLVVGFQNLSAQAGTNVDTYNLFKLCYFLNPILGFNIDVGNDTVVSGTPAVTTNNVAAGVGIFYNIFKSRSDTGISTAFKLKVEYPFDTRGINAGDVVVGIGTTFGI